jgi:hypothetical protein
MGGAGEWVRAGLEVHRMGRWARIHLLSFAGLAIAGCSHGAATAPSAGVESERPATPADAPPRPRASTQYAGGERRAGWDRYEQRKTLKVGQTVTAGPVPYAKVKLVEIAEDRRSAVFEATHLVDHRRGRVLVGESFNVFTPVFGSKGARLESLDDAGAAVVFRWAQRRGMPVPPGAVARSDHEPDATEP